MKVILIIVASVLVSGCVRGDCTKDCYILVGKDLELEYKCNMDPYRSDCPVDR